MEDLIDAEEFGKNDYDWLLTPPEPPSVKPSSATPSGRSNGRSVSTTRASRLSAPPSEKSHSTRPVRSSSATRPSISNTSSHNTRPSTPGNVPATARPSRQSPARSATPARTRPPPASAGAKTARPQKNSRPSTPTSRPQIPSNSNPNAAPPSAPPRSNSRPSTPTRRPLAPSAGRPTPRPISPGPHARAAVRPADQILDFPVVAPPNPRTKQPERPTSAGRTRQGAAPAARRHSLPGSNGNDPEGELQRPNKVAATATGSTGFGRMVSKSSLDMALRHMDIRQGTGGIRGSSLFPHSIRSAAPKCRPDQTPDPAVPARPPTELFLGMAAAM
ncbi:mucin-5AC-like [Iris pallida]|uniref:Mucin-5AC-like n=1 Tax=Iris pallida TaxID=29817 RepID=A0AAX6HLC2_IRIPA|nr:mucin-5AC-like [Iris pallida]